jgi:bifunctional ADP-heptose synthase (sugar kinase/adenylyltransferase)
MKIVICGSMSAARQIMEIAKFFTQKGHEVVVPKDTDQYASGKLPAESPHESTNHKIEHDLIRRYYSIIKEADVVIVANYNKGNINNHIGGNSFLEAGFAHVLNNF